MSRKDDGSSLPLLFIPTLLLSLSEIETSGMHRNVRRKRNVGPKPPGVNSSRQILHSTSRKQAEFCISNGFEHNPICVSCVTLPHWSVGALGYTIHSRAWAQRILFCASPRCFYCYSRSGCVLLSCTPDKEVVRPAFISFTPRASTSKWEMERIHFLFL